MRILLMVAVIALIGISVTIIVNNNYFVVGEPSAWVQTMREVVKAWWGLAFSWAFYYSASARKNS